MIAVTSSKQWIHFFLSDLWPPTSNSLMDTQIHTWVHTDMNISFTETPSGSIRLYFILEMQEQLKHLMRIITGVFMRHVLSLAYVLINSWNETEACPINYLNCGAWPQSDLSRHGFLMIPKNYLQKDLWCSSQPAASMTQWTVRESHFSYCPRPTGATQVIYCKCKSRICFYDLVPSPKSSVKTLFNYILCLSLALESSPVSSTTKMNV